MIGRFLKKLFGIKNIDDHIWEEDGSKMKPMVNTLEIVSAWLKQGKVIKADWDAGGDQTCCNISIDGEYTYQFEQINFCDLIGEWIVDRLNLPNIGEKYHKGAGEWFV